MLGLFGRLFSFVQKDVEEKEKILIDLHKGKPDNYQTVGRMINAECAAGKKPKELGCRTLLRLHRFLSYSIPPPTQGEVIETRVL